MLIWICVSARSNLLLPSCCCTQIRWRPKGGLGCWNKIHSCYVLLLCYVVRQKNLDLCLGPVRLSINTSVCLDEKTWIIGGYTRPVPSHNQQVGSNSYHRINARPFSTLITVSPMTWTHKTCCFYNCAIACLCVRLDIMQCLCAFVHMVLCWKLHIWYCGKKANWRGNHGNSNHAAWLVISAFNCAGPGLRHQKPGRL